MKSNLSKAGENLERALVVDNLKEIIVSLSDSIITSIIPVAAVVPPVNFLCSVIKSVNSYKDDFMIEKTISFLKEIDNNDSDLRRKAIEKFNESNNLGEKFGRFILLSIERVDSNLKASALGKIQKYFDRGKIEVRTFERLCFVVENIFTSDMKRIMDGKLKEFNKYSPSTKNLISLGLLEEKIKITSSDYLQKNFSLNTSYVNNIIRNINYLINI